jgi:hypothetical protein
MFQVGDLVKIIQAPDQDKYFMKHLWGKMGIIIEKVNTSSSPNIWKVLVGDQIHHLHKLDLQKLN